MTKAPNKVHKAAGIIPYIREDDGLKFLLVKNSIGWEFPKGSIEEGESQLEAAKREAEEEVGLVIDNIHSSFMYVSKYFLTKNYETNKKLESPEPKTVTYFLGEAPSKEIRLSFEHDSYGWFTFLEANKKLKWNKKREALQHAVYFL
jgi:8-oxo-dGTP pyrophosphatase MutT (NUDIX family)